MPGKWRTLRTRDGYTMVATCTYFDHTLTVRPLSDPFSVDHRILGYQVEIDGAELGCHDTIKQAKNSAIENVSITIAMQKGFTSIKQIRNFDGDLIRIGDMVFSASYDEPSVLIGLRPGGRSGSVAFCKKQNGAIWNWPAKLLRKLPYPQTASISGT